jgi:hypothetical protein
VLFSSEGLPEGTEGILNAASFALRSASDNGHGFSFDTQDEIPYTPIPKKGLLSMDESGAGASYRISYDLTQGGKEDSVLKETQVVRLR